MQYSVSLIPFGFYLMPSSAHAFRRKPSTFLHLYRKYPVKISTSNTAPTIIRYQPKSLKP